MKILYNENNEKYELLSKSPLFSNLLPEFLMEAAIRSKTFTLSREETMYAIKEGTRNSGVFILVNGEAQIVKDKQIVEELNLFGVFGLLETIAKEHDYHTSLKIVSRNNTFLWIPYKIIHTIIEEDERFRIDAMIWMAKSSLHYIKLMTNFIDKATNTDKVISRFNDLSKELLLLMGRTEIEKKFLFKRFSINELLENLTTVRYVKLDVIQFYTTIEDEFEERYRQLGDKYFKTIKKGSGQERSEKESEISQTDFEMAKAGLTHPPILKTRYLFKDNRFKDLLFDFYSNSEFVICEIEFILAGDAEYFSINDLGDWISKFNPIEVTNDKRFKNKELFLNGFPQI